VRQHSLDVAKAAQRRLDAIVDCRGIGAMPLKVINPALCSLAEHGLARLDPLGIGIDVTSDCAVIDQLGTASERLFAVGPLTRAAFWEIVAIPDIRNQCPALATRLSRVGDAISLRSASHHKMSDLSDRSADKRRCEFQARTPNILWYGDLS
jgi:uncharacterized NAD(P)/FAD-binding protein YdhS